MVIDFFFFKDWFSQLNRVGSWYPNKILQLSLAFELNSWYNMHEVLTQYFLDTFTGNKTGTTERTIANLDQIYRMFSIWSNLTRFDHFHFWKCALVDPTDCTELLSVLERNFKDAPDSVRYFPWTIQNKKVRIVRIWPNSTTTVDLIAANFNIVIYQISTFPFVFVDRFIESWTI